MEETKNATMEPKTTNQFPPKVLFKAEFIIVACSGFEETSPQLPFVSESKKNDKQRKNTDVIHRKQIQNCRRRYNNCN